ncbi:MAG: glycosyltransferase family 4 protein [Candidatus Eremiobacteraeota bacterium]|nr:glycosyltransferase family 4 protein [Candidatus Eremiobacteraeota bacterium]
MTGPGAAKARRPLHIALATESDGMGGAETMLAHLARGLRTRGHQVDLLVPAHGSGWLADQLQGADVSIRPLSLGRVRWTPVSQIRHALSEMRADVLHSHMVGLAVFGAAATVGLGVPHVITMHGTGRETSAARRRWALRAALRTSAAPIAVSDGLRHELRGLIGPVADRMTVLPNGVPERTGAREPTRRALRIRDDEVLILAVGNLFHNKAHAVLLDALARVPVEVPWRLIIAGRREDAAESLDARITALGWEQRVQLLGPRDDVPDLLAASDVYAMPSLNEALPMALLEAMAAGKPIVASAVGGIPEAVRTEREGLLVPPGDVDALGVALDRLLCGAALRQTFGRQARQRARAQYGLARMIEAHESLYYHVAERAGDAPPLMTNLLARRSRHHPGPV